jgi:hypothetical protein
MSYNLFPEINKVVTRGVLHDADTFHYDRFGSGMDSVYAQMVRWLEFEMGVLRRGNAGIEGNCLALWQLNTVNHEPPPHLLKAMENPGT